MTKLTPAEVDVRNLQLLRANVERLITRACADFFIAGDIVLDVAPQDHAGVGPSVRDGVRVETLDIDPGSGATYVADICQTNDEAIQPGRFQHIVCTEVLEHTLQPFDAIDEVWRLLAPGGYLFLSTPFGFRIHGPLPDCWRFTEHGLRVLLQKFEIVDLEPLEDPDRPLMPIHYTVVARKPN